ncbi:MAG: hypothetical protein ACXWSC_04005 [Bdellovibrionota bacterium]
MKPLFLALIFLSNAAYAEQISLTSLTDSALSFLGSQQVKQRRGIYAAGEWPSQVYSSPLPALFGIGRLEGDEEATAFSTASVMNELAEIRDVRPELAQISALLGAALPSLERYREGDLYNFYPPLLWQGVRVHQPAAMRLSPQWKGITNVPQDADTTSAVYAARFYAGTLNALPSSVARSFARFRDRAREPHWYDRDLGFSNTGSFLTWQFDENDPSMPRSFFADPAEGTRIPFGHNDVDCVVNLNVLRTLALTKTTQQPGRAAACRLAGEVVAGEKYARCGIYYPNTYAFAYSAAMADKVGETCLRPYGARLVEFVLRNQSTDDGWFNLGNQEVNDRVQSTAFAMIALARFGSSGVSRVRSALRRGTRFLYSRVKRSANGAMYWPGETFFTATAAARSLVDWRSDSFTTAVALGAILRGAEKLTISPLPF